MTFFSQAVSNFQASGSELEVVCTVNGPRHVSGSDGLAPLPPSRQPRLLVVLDSSFNPPTIAHMKMAVSAVEQIEKLEINREDAVGGTEPHNQETARLLLLLAIVNADKAPQPAATEQRLAMMHCFAQDVLDALATPKSSGNSTADSLAVDIALTTRPYFHQKSEAIADCSFYSQASLRPERINSSEHGYDKETAVEQIFLAGYDTLIRIFNPRYYGAESSPSSGGKSTPQSEMRAALAPFFERALLWVTLRTEDKWGDQREQDAYISSLLNGDYLEDVGGMHEWAQRIEIFQGLGHDTTISSSRTREAVKKGDWKTLREMVSSSIAIAVETENFYRGS